MANPTKQIDTRAAMQSRARFDSKVDRRGEDECWLWTGAVTKRGYGRFVLSGGHFAASRMAAYYAGILSDQTKHILHHCDNPPCCNPAHLYQGTHQDNVRDMVSRGRAKFRNAVKLSPSDAKAIRDSNSGASELARIFGVSPSLISRVKRGLVWKEAA